MTTVGEMTFGEVLGNLADKCVVKDNEGFNPIKNFCMLLVYTA